MLFAASDLKGFTIGARDCDLGEVKDTYFDDESWAMRYLVVDVGERIPSRKVLISPLAIRATEWERRRVDVALTCQQVRDSPDVDTEKPVSRQYETAYFDYYGFPYYWAGPDLWGPGPLPDASAVVRELAERAGRAASAGDPHLRSDKEVHGYHIKALDGRIGHVDDLLIDTKTWRISYIAIDTRNYWPGRHVLIAPEWIAEVSWKDRTARVAVTREVIRRSPKYTARGPVSPEYERQLREHYASRDIGYARRVADQRADTDTLCRNVMKTDVKWILSDTTVEDAAVKMRDERVGFLPVCDPQGRVLGAITDRDIAVRAVAYHESAQQPVVGFMTEDVVACSPEDDLRHAQELMRRQKVARIMCVNENGVLEGVISLSDIAELHAGPAISATLRSVSSREARVS